MIYRHYLGRSRFIERSSYLIQFYPLFSLDLFSNRRQCRRKVTDFLPVFLVQSNCCYTATVFRCVAEHVNGRNLMNKTFPFVF